MFYSEYLMQVKKEIQKPLSDHSHYKNPTTYICIAISRIAHKNMFATDKHRKQLIATIRSKLTKENTKPYKLGDELPALFFPELGSTELSNLEKRIKWLDGLISNAIKREAKVCQRQL